MRKICINLVKNYHIVILLVFLGLMLVVHQNLYLSGIDDNFYNVIAKCDISDILDFLKWHYFYKNGRIWIHFLTILFLKFDVYLWRVINPCLFTLLAYLTGNLLADSFGDKRKSITFATLFYLIIDYHYITSAVYWLSASFNYLIPMLIFVLLLIFYNKKKYIATLTCVILVGFGTEQSSMMTIGFFVLSILYKIFFDKDKRLGREIIYVCISTIGLITVLAFPSLEIRSGLAGTQQTDLSTIVFRLNDIVYLDWLGTKKTISFIFLITASTVISLLSLEKRLKLIKIVDCLWACIITVLGLAHLCNVFFTEMVNNYIYYAYLIFLFSGMIYSSIKLVFIEKEVFPFMMLILGTGSQIMLSITNTWIFRTCFPGIICFSMYILFVWGKSINMWKNKKWILVVLIPLLVVLLSRNICGYVIHINEQNPKVESFCKNEATYEDYTYVISNAEDGDFWYKNQHGDFFKDKIK